MITTDNEFGGKSTARSWISFFCVRMVISLSLSSLSKVGWTVDHFLLLLHFLHHIYVVFGPLRTETALCVRTSNL